MASAFDFINSSLRELFRYQTIQSVASNLCLWTPLMIASANAVDCLMVSKESNDAIRDKKDGREKGLQLEVTFRLISLITIDVPSLCLGSLVTFYRGQSQNILSTMINSKDSALIETLSRELAVVSERLGMSRDAMKALVLASASTNLWFAAMNWYKGRDSWFRTNLRKMALTGNLVLFYMLSKPLDVQIQ